MDTYIVAGKPVFFHDVGLFYAYAWDIRVRPSFAAKDILLAIKDHLECVVAREKRPLRLLKEVIETFIATHAMTAYGI